MNPMRRTALLPIIALLLTSCNGTKREIKKSAMGYLTAMGNYNILDAYAYADHATQESTLEYFNTIIIPLADSNYINQNRPAEITIKQIEILSDTNAMVAYHKHTPITEQDGDLEMVLEDGKWVAHVVIVVPDIIRQGSADNGNLPIRKFQGTLREVHADSTNVSRN